MPRINAEYREDARRKILNAALAVAETKGLETVTLDEIAQRVGVTKSALYAYFDNRDALIRELVVEIFHRNQAEVKDALADDPYMPVMLERLGKWIFASHIQYASLFVQIKTNYSDDPMLRKIFSDSFSQISDIIGKQISHMQELGKIPNKGDPEELATTITAFAIGLKVLSKHMGSDSNKVRQIWENTAHLILSHPSDGT